MGKITLENLHRKNVLQILLSSVPKDLFESSNLDVFHRGLHLNRSYFTSTNSIQMLAIDDLISVGATVRIQRVERYFPCFRLATQELESELNTETWFNIYISTLDSVGLGVHTDSHSVLAFQLLGLKNWTLPTLIDPKDIFHDSSWVFVPKDTEHKTQTKYPLSIHLTFGCNKTLCESEVLRCVKIVQGSIAEFLNTDYSDKYISTNFPKSKKLASLVRMLSSNECFEVSKDLNGTEIISLLELEADDYANSTSKHKILDVLKSNKQCFGFYKSVAEDEILVIS